MSRFGSSDRDRMFWDCFRSASLTGDRRTLLMNLIREKSFHYIALGFWNAFPVDLGDYIEAYVARLGLADYDSFNFTDVFEGFCRQKIMDSTDDELWHNAGKLNFTGELSTFTRFSYFRDIMKLHLSFGLSEAEFTVDKFIELVRDSDYSDMKFWIGGIFKKDYNVNIVPFRPKKEDDTEEDKRKQDKDIRARPYFWVTPKGTLPVLKSYIKPEQAAEIRRDQLGLAHYKSKSKDKPDTVLEMVFDYKAELRLGKPSLFHAEGYAYFCPASAGFDWNKTVDLSSSPGDEQLGLDEAIHENFEIRFSELKLDKVGPLPLSGVVFNEDLWDNLYCNILCGDWD